MASLTCDLTPLDCSTTPKRIRKVVSPASRSDVTQILLDLQAGRVDDDTAAKRIFELTYDELRHLAAGLMRGERSDHTLQPTELVHEAYCRLVDQTRVGWQNRAHFFGIAARAMREILVDHARQRAAAKRGGNWQRVTFNDALGVGGSPEIEVLELDDALTRLGELDERAARVVELRSFGGLKLHEIAHALGVSMSTVEGDWRVARMWLNRELLAGQES
jgi:RNA polymerase sigma-70 factor (ECF subfamily)